MVKYNDIMPAWPLYQQTRDRGQLCEKERGYSSEVSGADASHARLEKLSHFHKLEVLDRWVVVIIKDRGEKDV